jgi:hypothetical protein
LQVHIIHVLLEIVMSVFLSKCGSCGYSIVKGAPCSNCGHSEAGEDKDDGVIEEFARRKELHNRNSSIFFCVQLFGGLFALLGSTAAVWGRWAKAASRSVNRLDNRPADMESSFINYDALAIFGIVIVVIFILVTIYHLFLQKSDSFLPVALNCPKCDERLDGLNIDYSQCPSCDVHLEAVSYR